MIVETINNILKSNNNATVGEKVPIEFVGHMMDKGDIDFAKDYILLMMNFGYLKNEKVCIYGIGDGIDQPRFIDDDKRRWVLGTYYEEGKEYEICYNGKYSIDHKMFEGLEEIINIP